MYKTGGGPSNAPEFNDVEEKVLSICSNIKGLEARHDSDTISMPTLQFLEVPTIHVEEEPTIHVEEVSDCMQIISTDTAEQETENTVQATHKIPAINESLDISMEDHSHGGKENKWDKWHPKALKARVSNVLKSNTATKASVTFKLDKLSAARLELVQLQMETARKQHQFLEEEHKLKMLHLANDEKRKQEIHKYTIEKLSCGPVKDDII